MTNQICIIVLSLFSLSTPIQAQERVKESEKYVQPRQSLVPLLHAFAKDFLRVSYMFWVNQEPYFKEDVLPCFLKK